MIVNGNANAKTGKKKTQRCKGARTQGKKKAGKKETQSRKVARAQGKPGSQNLEQLFSTLPSYLHLDCNLDCNPFPSPYFFSSSLLCVLGWTRKRISRLAA